MSRRDTYLLAVVGVIAVIGAFWLLVLAPKRSELQKLDTQVTETQAAAVAARQQAEQFSRDRLQYPQAYAALVRLGKAVPADPDVPSLLLQLNAAATDAGVDFRKINLDTGKGTGPAASQAPPTPAPSPQAGAQATGQSTGATGAAGQTGSGSAGAGATGATGSSAASGGATATATATAVTAATVPIGTSVGPAGFPTLKMKLSFEGSFFKLADFVRNVRALVRQRNQAVSISGRLLTIDGIAFGEGAAGFPHIKASIVATAYLVPASQGLLAGATPQGPGGAAPTTPIPAGGAAPPTAVVSP